MSHYRDRLIRRYRAVRPQTSHGRLWRPADPVEARKKLQRALSFGLRPLTREGGGIRALGPDEDWSSVMGWMQDAHSPQFFGFTGTIEAPVWLTIDANDLKPEGR